MFRRSRASLFRPFRTIETSFCPSGRALLGTFSTARVVSKLVFYSAFYALQMGESLPSTLFLTQSERPILLVAYRRFDPSSFCGALFDLNAVS